MHPGTDIEEQVEGRTLFECLDYADPIEQRLRQLPAVLAAAEAVGVAHAQGRVHRNITPHVIVVGANRTVVAAWHGRDTPPVDVTTRSGLTVSTVAFQPLERVTNRPVGPSSDVYSLGAVLYFLVTGRPPYLEPSDVVTQNLAAIAPSRIGRQRGVPRELASIINHAMQPHPEQRYPNAAALAHDLRDFLFKRHVSVHRYTIIDSIRGCFGADGVIPEWMIVVTLVSIGALATLWHYGFFRH